MVSHILLNYVMCCNQFTKPDPLSVVTCRIWTCECLVNQDSKAHLSPPKVSQTSVGFFFLTFDMNLIFLRIYLVFDGLSCNPGFKLTMCWKNSLSDCLHLLRAGMLACMHRYIVFWGAWIKSRFSCMLTSSPPAERHL